MRESECVCVCEREKKEREREREKGCVLQMGIHYLPSGTRAMLMKACRRYASSAITLKSHARAKDPPAPAAAPFSHKKRKKMVIWTAS